MTKKNIKKILISCCFFLSANSLVCEKLPSVEALSSQFNDLPDQQQKHAKKIINHKLTNLDSFYQALKQNPEMNLSYNTSLNKSLQRTAAVHLRPENMTQEQLLFFLRSINKKLQNLQFQRQQETIQAIDQQLLEAQEQALEMVKQQSLETVEQQGFLPELPDAPNLLMPSNETGSILKQASFKPMNLPPLPEFRIVGSDPSLSFDSETNSDGEIQPTFVKFVAKASRDFKSAASDQSVLNNDLKKANHENRLSNNAVMGEGSTPISNTDLLQPLREKRRLDIQGITK